MESIPRNGSSLIPVSIAILILLLLCPFATAQEHDSPSPIDTIFVIPGSHWDLGFTRPPDEQMDAIKPHLDEVIADCDADPEFRWTIESTWQLQAWLDRTKDPAQVERLVKLIRRGQIELSAPYSTPHTEFTSAEELNRLDDNAARIEKQLGIHSDMAMLNDVPGFSSRLPQVLARSGLRYLITGSNLFIGGGTSLWPGTMPFYWEGPDGSRVLTWQTQGKDGGYTEGMADYFLSPDAKDPYSGNKFRPKEWDGLPPLEIMRRGIQKLTGTYTAAGYRHSAIAVFFMHDAIGPNYEKDGLLPSVHAWNAAGNKPRLVVATPSEFFRYIETHSHEQFPAYRGDWAGLWAEAKTSSPAISADARWLHDHIPEAESIWSLISFHDGLKSYPQQTIQNSWNGLMKYDEHNGAGNTGWPKVMTKAEVDTQNREYADPIRNARAEISNLISLGVAQIASNSTNSQSGRKYLIVFNPLSWARSEMVTADLPTIGIQLRDSTTGKLVPTQDCETEKLCFFAEAVPPFGYKSYEIESRTTANPPTSDSATELDSPFYRVQVNPDNAEICSIYDKVLQAELLSGCIRLSPEPAGGAKTSVVHRHGPVVDDLTIRRPGTFWPETQIVLPQQKAEVQIIDTLDREQMPSTKYKDPAHIYTFAYDFRFDNSAQRWIGDDTGFHRLPQDYLPGARLDAAVPQHSLVLSGLQGPLALSVVFSQRQAFFDRFETKSSTFANGLRVLAFKKSDQGETKDQGVVTFPTLEPGYGNLYRYTTTITANRGGLDIIASYREGWEAGAPLSVVALRDRSVLVDAEKSYFSVNAPNVVIEAFRPSNDGQDGHYMLRLQEISGASTECAIRTSLEFAHVTVESLTEQGGSGSEISLSNIHLGPYETKTLLLARPIARARQ